MHKAYNLLERRDHEGGARWRSRSKSEENGSVAAYGGLELALGAAIGGGVLGGVVGALGWLGKGARKANLVGVVSSSASEFRGKGGFPRRLGVYPRDAMLAADEDARATPSCVWPGAWRRWTQLNLQTARRLASDEYKRAFEVTGCVHVCSFFFIYFIIFLVIHMLAKKYM